MREEFINSHQRCIYINWMDCSIGNGSQKMGPIFRHFGRSGMRSSRKVVIGDGMDCQGNDSDRWRIVIRSQKQSESRKNEPKKVDLGIWHWLYFFNIVQSIYFIYTTLYISSGILFCSFLIFKHTYNSNFYLRFSMNTNFDAQNFFQSR